MFDPIYVRPNQFRPNSYTSDTPMGAADPHTGYTGDAVGEMERRAAAIRGMAEARTRYAQGLNSIQSVATKYRADYESLKTSFTEKYGTDDPSIRQAELFGDSDKVELSDRAKEYLADLGKLERLRGTAEFLAWGADFDENASRKTLVVWEAMDEMAASSWDMRFSPTKAARVEAWNKFADAGNRMAKNGFENDYIFAVRDVRNAAVTAGNAALTEGLSGAALFKVSDSGRIDFDAKGLEHLSPDAQQAEQLKRLVEIMSVRNGLSPLRGVVAKALDIQNAYIAAHPVVTGVVELPF